MATTILDVCQVAPPPNIATPFSLPLTFYDLLWLKHSPVENLFFYQATNLEPLFSHLKHSLSQTLQHFPILAGHMTWPITSPVPLVTYQDGDSVALTIARSDADFRHLNSTEFRKAEDYHPLLPILAPEPRFRSRTQEEPGSRTPVLAVQVTVFEGKGFSVGIVVNHAFIDGNSKTAFLKAWASVSKFGENREPAPTFERDNRFSKLDKLYGDMWLKNNMGIRENLYTPKIDLSPGKLRGTFELEGLKLEKLKKYVNSKGIHRVSSFALAYSYALVCLVKARKVEKQRIVAIILADYRARLDPPLPMTYFGNCIRQGGTKLDLGDLLGDDGITFAMCALNEGIDTCVSGGLEWAENRLPNMFADSHRVSEIISMAGSNHFGLYGVDFGWGKPVRVETSSIDGTGAISFSDGKNGSGVEIGLVLRKDEMETFASLFEQGCEDV